MTVNFREFYQKQEKKIKLREELEALKEGLIVIQRKALLEVKKEIADNMKKQYGDKWKEVYYATANKQGRDPETWEKVKECDTCGCEDNQEEDLEELDEAAGFLKALGGAATSGVQALDATLGAFGKLMKSIGTVSNPLATAITKVAKSGGDILEPLGAPVGELGKNTIDMFSSLVKLPSSAIRKIANKLESDDSKKVANYIADVKQSKENKELQEAKKKKKKQIKAPYEGSERSGNKHLPPAQKRIKSEKEKQKFRARRKASDKKEMDEGEKGLWDNIQAKRKRGEKAAKPGDKDYPDEESWEKAKMKEGGKCTGPTEKASSISKGKKWMKCVKNPDGEGYKRVHWGQKGVRATGDSGDTKRKKSFRARHKCDSAKPGTPKYQACKDW